MTRPRPPHQPQEPHELQPYPPSPPVVTTNSRRSRHTAWAERRNVLRRGLPYPQLMPLNILPFSLDGVFIGLLSAAGWARADTMAPTTLLPPAALSSPATAAPSSYRYGVGKRKRVIEEHDKGIMTSGPCPEPAVLSRALKCVCLPKLPTGLVHDSSHRFHKHPTRKHPERPERIEAIMTHLGTTGLAAACTLMPPARAEEDDLVGVHNQFYIRRLHKLAGASKERLLEEAEQYDSVYLNESTVDCAKRAAGGLLQLVKGVVEGRLRNGMAIIRPPGHHAEAHHARGFCVINNVAVAASYARKKLGVKRVLIVDWDVHHGNGTQRAFLDDPSVLYLSLHRYDHGRFFPGGADGSPSQVGVGAGAGYTVNVAWNGSGVGDEEYLEAWRRVVMPVATAFAPELVLVSAGFDGVVGDEMGGCEITPECFGAMTRQLMKVAPGVVLALEGGYKLSVLPRCVEECLKGLQQGEDGAPAAAAGGGGMALRAEAEEEEEEEQGGDVAVEEQERSILPEAKLAIDETVKYHQKYLLGQATVRQE